MEDEFAWLTGRVLRAARVLSGCSSQEVASLAGLGEATIKRAEASTGRPRLTRANAAAIVNVYAGLGIRIETSAADGDLTISVSVREGPAD